MNLSEQEIKAITRSYTLLTHCFKKLPCGLCEVELKEKNKASARNVAEKVNKVVNSVVDIGKVIRARELGFIKENRNEK